MALSGGRYAEEATRPHAACGTIASEAQADRGTAVWKIVNESDVKEESTQGQGALRPCE
jgi:hypothetical protein